MAKKIGEHGDNANRTAYLWHLPYVPAVAAEFGVAAFRRANKFPLKVSMCVLALVNDLISPSKTGLGCPPGPAFVAHTMIVAERAARVEAEIKLVDVRAEATNARADLLNYAYRC